jgi:hypothetical protein
MKKRSENTITIFQTKKGSMLVTLPKQALKKRDLSWISSDKLEYEFEGDQLILRKKAR